LSLDASRRVTYCGAMRYFFHIASRSESLSMNWDVVFLLESAKRHAEVLVEELRKGGLRIVRSARC
jgi:hypothetical protein